MPADGVDLTPKQEILTSDEVVHLVCFAADHFLLYTLSNTQHQYVIGFLLEGGRIYKIRLKLTASHMACQCPATMRAGQKGTPRQCKAVGAHIIAEAKFCCCAGQNIRCSWCQED